ncbi:MAG: right-handed parallel beta-helix repeat-containing protein, partial [Armatimonadota bacterium]
MRTTISALLAIIVALAAWPAVAQVDQQALADVASGKLTVAKASWWGFDATDATQCLQAAIDSKVPKLIVDKLPTPWIVLPLTLVSNQEIEFEKGVEVLAKRGAYVSGNDSLITGSLVENVTLRGYGATLRMWRDDYDKEPYKHAEWRHVINLHSCSNLKILGLVLTESGGDGIYLGTGKEGVTNKDIVIKDVVCDKNYRQGISVITAENLLIENTVLSNTNGTAPRAGIDFEPNGPTERVVNCVMRNCEAYGNAGCGYVAYIPTLNATSAPVGLRLENCKAYDNVGPPAVFMTGNTPAAAVTGKLELVNCEFRGAKTAGLTIMGNPPTGLRVLVDRCSLLDNASEAPTLSPIMLEAGNGATEDMGGIKFVDCLIRDALGRKPMSFTDNTGNLRVVDVTGNLLLEKEGQKTPVAITDKLLAEWMPVLKLKRIARFKTAGLS